MIFLPLKEWTKFGYNIKVITSLNIFLLDVNFDKSTIKLYFLLISFMLAKFLEN